MAINVRSHGLPKPVSARLSPYFIRPLALELAPNSPFADNLAKWPPGPRLALLLQCIQWRTDMFANREEAGVELAQRLRKWSLTDPIVLGIPRGGVVVAAAIGRELGAELDVVLARKLRSPHNTEFAIGAVDEDGQVVRNAAGIAAVDIGDVYVQQEIARQVQEIAERKALYRAARPAASLAQRSIILTDDGLATGSTMIAALQALRKKEPREIILAVPVASPDRLREAEKLADRTVCLLAPPEFTAVGAYYANFYPVDDRDVLDCLRETLLIRLKQ
jgi:predicted phosphoribosyltransferase